MPDGGKGIMADQTGGGKPTASKKKKTFPCLSWKLLWNGLVKKERIHLHQR
jgi:hypothetical protein